MKLRRFFREHVVFVVAAILAGVSCCFVPPDEAYLEYFDWKTLSCLFLTLAVVCALRNIKFFTILARRLVTMAGNLRALFLLLVVITFVGSMIIANDMALITFLPLGYFALSVTKKERYMAYLFVLQNVSANLGGMLTPFGNPQNLYLYSFFHVDTGEFCRVMLPPFLLSVALLVLACLPVKAAKFTLTDEFDEKLNVKKANAATEEIPKTEATTPSFPSTTASSSKLNKLEIEKQTANVPTTFSLAIKPVMAAAANCHATTPTTGAIT